MNRILLVEDDESLRLLYSKELQEDGYHVQTAVSGEEALDFLQRHPVDLVVLDLKLGNMHGLDTLDQMMRKKRNLKVVINTAYAQYMDDFTSWLADAYIIKAADMSELKSSIHNLLPLKAQ